MFRKKNQLKDSFFDNINGVKLDKYQRKVIVDDNPYTLVVAGAGSGKTLTIVGKVKYLIERKGYNEKDILCLSFTNETVNNLKEKIPFKVDVYTFHKLSLNVLKDWNINYHIANDRLLTYIINEYFLSLNEHMLMFLYEYFPNLDLNTILNSNRLQILKLNINSFIKKIKCSDLSMKDLYKLKKKVYNKDDKIFLLFALDILRVYTEELLSERKIDFDDMIAYAKDIVVRKGIKRKYKYIIIDEYQDISKIRFMLIKEILNCTKAKLMCVGDDYQSIYGFSGSNISLFVDFFDYFKDAKRIDIKNTYRNSYELINTSVQFIMKNSYQLRKTIYATKLNKYPIVLVYYDNYLETYQTLLDYLYLEEKKNLLVLARYNKDLKEVYKIENKGLNINYLTIHRSKGLECDNVIVLKMEDKYLGFPSKIRNNNVLSLIDKNKEEIDYAEERRLFYVALTRCREKVYLLVPRKNPSKFIEEIKSKCVELLLK